MACVVDEAPGAEGAIGGAAGAEVIAGAGAPGRAARGRVLRAWLEEFCLLCEKFRGTGRWKKRRGQVCCVLIHRMAGKAPAVAYIGSAAPR